MKMKKWLPTINLNGYKNSLRVGLLLGLRQIRHASIWTTGLIIFVMMLTFLNLVVVSGILVGLIEGSIKAYSEQFTGEIFIATPEGEEYIKESSRVLLTLKNIPGIKDYSARFTDSATIEANYRVRRDPTELPDRVGVKLAGINPLSEDRVTNLSKYVVDGEYLLPSDSSYIMIGANLLDQYAPDFGEGFDTLENVYPGTRVKLSSGDRSKEYIVKGIIDSKVDETSRRIFMTDSEFIRFVGRSNLNVNEIAIIPNEDIDPAIVKQRLVGSGLGKTATIRQSREALPQALEDIIMTFELLGNAISSIGLIVSSITVFIVVFVNAITRRKFIGILKGIGVSAWAIEFSYVFQSLVYAVSGAVIAMIIIYAFLVPFFDSHPIDFPFSDGILVAPLSGTLIRLMIMIIATLIAGFVPAWLIIKKNTLDSILGR